jgi:hypothetical protein
LLNGAKRERGTKTKVCQTGLALILDRCFVL